MNYKPPFDDTLPSFPIDPDAYGIIYYHEYRTFNKSEIHRVEILRKSYLGDFYEIRKSGANPVTLTHVGTGKDGWEDSVLQGQNLTFNFIIPKASESTFNLLFESDFHELQLKYTISGITEFIGWVQPENLVKNYSRNAPFLEISITAYDGLVDLKNFDFADDPEDAFDDANSYTGRIKLLEILKTAVARTGIPLNFAVQLNTFSGLYTVLPGPAVRVLASEGLDQQFAVTTEDGKMIIIEDITF